MRNSSRLLVCEGPCGQPDVDVYDRAVRTMSANANSNSATVAGKDVSAKLTAIEVGRRLVHTEHSPTYSTSPWRGSMTYVCAKCGTQRLY